MSYFDDEMYQRWVQPYYLKFMNGKFLRTQPQQPLAIDALQGAIEQIDGETIDTLLTNRNWRHRLAGACFAGLKLQYMDQDEIGKLLFASEAPYAGWGYCFALARFASTRSNQYLTLYLNTFLLRYHDEYDQGWALAALLWLDAQHQTDDAQIYLLPAGLWENFVRHRHVSVQERWKDIDAIKNNFAACMENCHRWFDG